MMTLQTEVSFDAAHRLSFHKGACKNLHGHRWRALIKISVDEILEGDMIIDFGHIKKFINDGFDHAVLVYDKDDFMMNLAVECDREEMKVMAVPFETTAENMAQYFAEAIKRMISPELVIPNKVSVTLWETPNNSVEVIL